MGAFLWCLNPTIGIKTGIWRIAFVRLRRRDALNEPKNTEQILG